MGKLRPGEGRKWLRQPRAPQPSWDLTAPPRLGRGGPRPCLGSGFLCRYLSSDSELLKARSGLHHHLPTPAPGPAPCTEGTFTKVHRSVRFGETSGRAFRQLGLDDRNEQLQGLLRRGQRPAAPRQPWALAPASLFPEWAGLGGQGGHRPQELPSWPRSATLSLDQKQGPARTLVRTGLECCPPLRHPHPHLGLHLQLAAPVHPSLPHLFLSTWVTRPLREDSLKLCWGLEGPRPRGRHGPALGGGPPRRRWRSAWMPGCAVRG